MAREIFISIYLYIFSFLFRLLNWLPAKRKIVFCCSFIENNEYLYEELKKQNPHCQTILLVNNKKNYSYFVNKKCPYDSVIFFSIIKFFSFIQSIYHLSTSKVIIVDNYFGFLSVANFKKDVKCLQIWHAVGAIKQFGLQDPSVLHRSKRAQVRFKKVYDKFEYVLVGSKKMENIFIQSFGLPRNNMLPFGVPRTDFFYYEDKEELLIKNKLYFSFPNLKDRKVILYAPTFRDGNIENFNLPIDLELLQKELNDDYAFILRLHPAITNTLPIKKHQNFVYDLSSYPSINELLLITDYLITDYSSIPFEFSFLRKPMIFYAYDLPDYTKMRGFYEPYEQLAPGPIVHSTKEIVELIKNDTFDLQKIDHFHYNWNEYSKGDASKKTIDLVMKWIN